MNFRDIQLDRARGAMLGLAVGDALGTTLEFSVRDSYEPLTDMIGGGRFGLKAPLGQQLRYNLLRRKSFPGHILSPFQCNILI